ncbi:predicted RNA-binding protein [Moesziomyces antarcticus T-34]|uniref:Predicted RNA-binding protein n=1 Tax=Pseudozyma antarctica (strain T-34) TaxID=1151754 RepID=M9MF02_PSEA3|nr:predicted RNA-binding protein [Moesziomyces antarcticus T-34]
MLRPQAGTGLAEHSFNAQAQHFFRSNHILLNTSTTSISIRTVNMSAWGAHGKIGGSAAATPEDAETPILCEPCLGPNPYIRMTKDTQGKICKELVDLQICTRPFTVFRWNPGAGSRFKKTEICTTCAKVKNVCQACILDLQYGLPVQMRDAALNIKSTGPTSDKNREYYAENMDKQLEGATSLVGASSSPAGRAGQELLKKMARKEPEYKRDRPVQFCAAFARGNCPRGDKCPFRHELPSEDALPFAAPATAATPPAPASAAATGTPKRILSSSTAAGLPPPADTSIVSLFISSLPADTTQDSLRSWMTALAPELRTEHIKSITLVTASRCAFVNFTSRQNAERAAAHCSPKMDWDNTTVRITWGRSRPTKK